MIPRRIAAALFAWLALAAAAAAQAPWPGQSGNAVGYAAYAPIGTIPCSSGLIVSGSAGNPTILKNCVFTSVGTITANYFWCFSCDFQNGTGSLILQGDHEAFIGCRSQSNARQSFNVYVNGATNWAILYSSMTPLASLYTSPPGGIWPSASSGLNTATQTDNVNSVAVNQGYEYGIKHNSGGPGIADRNDIWGFGAGIILDATTGEVVFSSNWIHDAAQATGVAGGDYHTDGLGYTDGGTGVSNVLAIGNVMASLGNTGMLTYQAATSGYSGINDVENYFSGTGYTAAFCAPGSVACTNSYQLGNVWGTDVEPLFDPLYPFTLGTGSTWACNTLSFRSGTAWTDGNGFTPTSGMNGQFWLISGSHAFGTTDYNSNTVCPTFGPASLDYLTQTVNTTSSGKTVTLTNTGSTTLAISSIALNAGTNFTISANTCGSTLAASASCAITVTFSPTVIAVYQDFLDIADNSPSPSSPQTIPLVGIGMASTVLPAPSPATFAEILFVARLESARGVHP